MIHAKPQLNGNTVEHFSEAYKSLTAAEKAIRAAIIDVQMNVLHGRNYQHLDATSDASLEYLRREDDKALDNLRRSITDIEKLKIDIATAVRGK